MHYGAFLVGFFSFLLLNIYTVKKKIFLTDTLVIFPFLRALVFTVRICASTLAKILMAELGKRVKFKRQAVGSNKDQNH